MNTQWIVETHGDPIGGVRRFIRSVWLSSELDGIIVSLPGEGSKAKPIILTSPDELERVNPFRPLMEVNTAKYLPDILERHPEGQLGALLRPCELRAVIEMVKLGTQALERLVTICVDCLSTYPAQDFEWRAQRKGSSRKLTRDTLQFSHLGGIAAYRYRSACQTCISPKAEGAYINLGVLGLPVREHVLVEVRDPVTADWLKVSNLAERPAEATAISKREGTIEKMIERNERTRERITHGLPDVLPTNVEVLIELFDACGTCQECFDQCPICEVAHPRSDLEGTYLKEDVAQWIRSCVGCGMCEQACPHHLPLSAIFHNIKAQLQETGGYTPGMPSPKPLAIW